MIKNIFAVCSIIIISSSLVQGATKDVTYHACLDVITNGLNNASIENQMYLIGRENGIEAGVELTYEKYGLNHSLRTSEYPYIIDEACKVVITDKSNRRAMTVFNKEVFILFTTTK